MEDKRFGWCFVGSGNITRRVLKDFAFMDGAYVASVYSKRLESAQAFAELAGAKAYADIEAAITAPGVDAVYVATPNSVHAEHALAAIRLGKPVLCEKPFAMNRREAGAVIGAAREAGLYLMEGMWTRFHPVIRQALAWIREGRIGRVLSLEADFAVSMPPSAPVRIFDRSLGGGGLLDLGVYTTALAQFVFGEKPEKIDAMGTSTPQGVDDQCAMLFQYADGAIARTFASMVVPKGDEAAIYGERGVIRLPHFVFGERAVLRPYDGSEEEEVQTTRGGVDGYEYQFIAVMEDIRAGRLENGWVTHQHTLDVMDTLDAVRAKIGLTFPADEA